jgi:hypothetical protein
VAIPRRKWTEKEIARLREAVRAAGEKTTPELARELEPDFPGRTAGSIAAQLRRLGHGVTAERKTPLKPSRARMPRQEPRQDVLRLLREIHDLRGRRQELLERRADLGRETAAVEHELSTIEAALGRHDAVLDYLLECQRQHAGRSPS